jgi:hypothetical protein
MAALAAWVATKWAAGLLWVRLRGLVFAGFVAVLVLVGVASFAWGVRDAAKRCEIAALTAEIKTLKADLQLARSAHADGVRREKDIEGRAAFLEQKVTDYEARLAKRPPALRCALDDDDVRSLRLIR